MFVDLTGDKVGGEKGDIYLITKNINNRNLIRIGKIPMRLHANLKLGDVTEIIEVINVGAPYSTRIWTGADMSANGSLIALRTGTDVSYFSRRVDQTVVHVLSSAPCQYIAPTSRHSIDESQYEAVAFASNFVVAETSECKNRLACEVPVHFYQLITKSNPAPSIPVTPSGSTRVVITEDEFAVGWGNFVAVGSYVSLSKNKDASCAALKTKVLLRNTDWASSLVHALAHKCSKNDQIAVSFWYYAVNTEVLDEFVLEYSPDNGNHWMIVQGWAKGFSDKFVNDKTCYQAQVLIDRKGLGSFTDLAKFRFRSNTPENDLFYIYSIKFVGIIFPVNTLGLRKSWSIAYNNTNSRVAWP